MLAGLDRYLEDAWGNCGGGDAQACDPDAPDQPDPICPGCDAKAEHIRFEYRWAGTHIDHWRCTDPECGDEFKTFNQ